MTSKKLPKIKIEVKYRGEGYYAKDVSIDRDGNLSFDYLHDLIGSVDSDHIQEVIIKNEHKN